MLTMVCCYLMYGALPGVRSCRWRRWAFTYLSQTNPMVNPTRNLGLD